MYNDIINEICMNCMRPKGGNAVCPHCGFENTGTQGKPYLPIGALVGGRYAIGRFLGANGDGATYVGYDLREKSAIIIREYLPKSLCTRDDNYAVVILPGREANFEDCKTDFLNLWRGIAKLRELTGLMTVYDILDDYETVYVISEYIETITFRDYLQAQPGGKLPWEEVKRLFMPIVSTVEELHRAGIVHGCISPNSLRICKDGKLRIFQFSIPEVRTTGVVLPTGISPGFAALEQYSEDDTIGPWSDVYSFCAVIYRSLTGMVLPEAPQRLEDESINIPDDVKSSVPDYVIRAMWNGLRLNPVLRTSNFASLRDQLNGVQVKIAEAVSPRQKDDEDDLSDEDAQKKGKGGIIALVIILLVLAASIALALTVFKDKTFELLGINTTTASSAEYTTSDEMVTVPDFVNANMTKEQIKQNVLWNENFYIVFSDGKDLHAEINHIYSQSVKAGKSVNKGSQIVLSVCIGRPDVTLPDVVGMKQSDAEKSLKNLGFKVTVAEIENDGTNATGVVSEMSKEPNLSYSYGTEVVLSVYSSPTTTEKEQETKKNDDNEKNTASASRN